MKSSRRSVPAGRLDRTVAIKVLSPDRTDDPVPPSERALDPPRPCATSTKRSPCRATYRRSGSFEGNTLALNSDGTFRFEGQSDAIDMCTGGRWVANGTFGREMAHLVIAPGPSMRRYGIDAPDLLLPVARGDRLYLLEDSQLRGWMIPRGSSTRHRCLLKLPRACLTHGPHAASSLKILPIPIGT
jgi:hypothetical protein